MKDVDAFDFGMGEGAAYQGAINHVGQINILDVVSLALDKPEVFLALDGLSDAAQRLRCNFAHDHPPLAILSAAYCTALTMF